MHKFSILGNHCLPCLCAGISYAIASYLQPETTVNVMTRPMIGITTSFDAQSSQQSLTRDYVIAVERAGEIGRAHV